MGKVIVNNKSKVKDAQALGCVEEYMNKHDDYSAISVFQVLDITGVHKVVVSYRQNKYSGTFTVVDSEYDRKGDD